MSQILKNDTIAAIATPLGEGGIGIIRISGEMSYSIAKELLPNIELESHRMTYVKVKDPSTKQVIDEAMVVYMKAPKSYTMEDIIEFQCHGGIIPVARILDLAVDLGARIAEPGEFTKRAFLNGRIDLSQAEAVIDVIRAKTDKAMDLAVRQLTGNLSKGLNEMNDKLLNLLAHIEAAIDFPEEDLETKVYSQVREDVRDILHSLKELLEESKKGKIYKEGITTAIIGKPNVGKSSLLNALVRESRAIVTHVPGTTRDIIEEVINIKGIPLRIVDTAGIRETEDIVEKIGVEKSKEILNKADLILFILDGSLDLTPEDRQLMELTKGKKAIAIINKTDLPQRLENRDIMAVISNIPILKTSMITGEGVQDIEDTIVSMVFEGKLERDTEPLLTNRRHIRSIKKAVESLELVKSSIELQYPIDCLSIDIKGAWESLGEITGENVTEDILDKIFSEFCIGK
jgi:tRNA modification GTPase